MDGSQIVDESLNVLIDSRALDSATKDLGNGRKDDLLIFQNHDDDMNVIGADDYFKND